jgi:broad specificity phosphatase PhoE
MNILLMRHAQCTANVEKVFAGNEPAELTPEGIVAAHEVPAKLTAAGYEIGQLHTSSLERAYQTAEIIAAGLALDRRSNFHTSELLRERNYAPFSGMKMEGIAGNPAIDFNKIEGIEKPKELLGRMLQFMGSIARTPHDGSDLLVVTHGSNLKVVRALMRQEPIDTYHLQPRLPNLDYDEYSLELDSSNTYLSDAHGNTVNLAVGLPVDA